MAEKDQVRPLAPVATNRFRSDEDDNLSIQLKVPRRRTYVKCCGCVTAILVLIAVTFIILAFTVFHVRGPIVKMITVTGDPRQLANITALVAASSNLTLIADMSVKNPNVASYRFGNTTTAVYCGGAEVGEGRNLGGIARARRTMRMNLTVDVSPAKLLTAPGFLAEYQANKSLTMNSFTRIVGRVKILNIVKKEVVVRLNCTVTYNLSSNAIQRQHCIRRVIL
ncbi:uncharacterized protein LOC133778521 [Humulus lupulus]|uniref:uncharacterized protein LOC133778521 n=1 Tax=Humulus lupulus TaxID=3486 RepID=UPI002B40DEAC|nr:uncharacterized protein LOC133778521 [Humulus lupulus]